MTELPSGTVTFLFTDIERSTESAEALGDERWAEALQTHRDLLRPAFDKHGGVEVGTEGDSFFVAFARAHDAVNAAADGQRALETYAWADEVRIRVRMGLHTGEALVRGSDYVGHDVHKAKRVSDAGHGGQILVSQTTAELVRDVGELADLGPHRLKDLGEPQRLYQVTADGLPSEFPPLRSLESFRHNLPPQRSAFIGREKQITELSELLDTNSLVTLTGVGGCGKTRLAIQIGAERLDAFPDGVFFVDLAQLADPNVVAATIAAAVGVPMQAEIGSGLRATTDELLFGFLAQRTCLVILDNCEHLLDACAEVVDRILAACPDVTVLATSREALDVEGEQSWRTPSLSLPADGDAQDSEAVSLFKTRAKTARTDFDLTPGNLDAVAEICRRLDGIPLAIEFAAARVSHLSPQEIAERLGDMFKLLAGGPRRRVQRQQTLQAALDWSYELLSETERLILRRLAVFPASFPLAAADGICSGDGVEEASVLDLLGSLVAKSLVMTEDREATTRYRLMETVRLYATEKLREAGEADVCRARHRDWYQAWIGSFEWDDILFVELPTIGAEQASLRAALEWSEAEDRLDLVVGMATRMSGVWIYSGNLEESQRWLTGARPEDLDVTTEERVVALTTLSNVLQREGSTVEFAERAVAAGGDKRGAPFSVARYVHALNTGIVSQWTRDPRLADAARREMDEAIRLAEGYPNATRFAREGRAELELLLGDVEAAAEAYAQLPAGIDVIDNASRAAAAHIVGDHDRAVAAARRVLDVMGSDTQYQAWDGRVAAAAAVALAGAGDVEAGRAILREHLDDTRRSARPGLLEGMLVSTAAVAYLTDDNASASRLLAWVRSRTFDAGRILPSATGYAVYQHYVQLVRAALDTEQAHKYRDEGRSMSEDDAVACARQVLS